MEAREGKAATLEKEAVSLTLTCSWCSAAAPPKALANVSGALLLLVLEPTTWKAKLTSGSTCVAVTT